ncbi:hypothetical protein CRE_08909 [Caenorhabditis remanei]|uniref:Uncharacterized protein n=1 Tax=Caenorhabditis remanei TaxID=31234 RepID=E3LI89_CAERE|nr:hypothetical protein CRE_08909 [Caenorhabditis remanei]
MGTSNRRSNESKYGPYHIRVVLIIFSLSAMAFGLGVSITAPEQLPNSLVFTAFHFCVAFGAYSYNKMLLGISQKVCGLAVILLILSLLGYPLIKSCYKASGLYGMAVKRTGKMNETKAFEYDLNYFMNVPTKYKNEAGIKEAVHNFNFGLLDGFLLEFLILSYTAGTYVYYVMIKRLREQVCRMQMVGEFSRLCDPSSV